MNIVNILYIVYFVLAVYTSATIIYRRSDPVKSLSWIVVILLIPYAGLLLFLFFGQNYRKRKIFTRKGAVDERIKRELAGRQIRELKNNPNVLPEEIRAYYKQIMLNLQGNRGFLGANSEITPFFRGRDALDAMYEAISCAKRHIHLQSYIIDDDAVGRKFKDILIQKCKDGVEVRIIYDDVGCWKLNKHFKNELTSIGIELLNFAPVTFMTPISKMNYRNHRKILVVDGEVGFIGGVNIAERYNSGGNFSEWRDAHIRIRGESVSSLQSSFLLDRYFIVNQQFKKRKKYYPHIYPDKETTITNKGSIYSQIITSGPDSDWASIMQCYLAAMASAKKSIFIITPYFTPNESILDAIKIAALGGVEVSIMLPEKSDTKIAHWSTLSYAAELLEAGVKVYLFIKGFNHAKLISIDGEFCIIGSANMDNRSLHHNFEITSIIYNAEIAKVVERRFKHDVEHCNTLASSKWAKRSVKNKIKESFARLWSPLL